jgi:hypothetical protein
MSSLIFFTLTTRRVMELIRKSAKTVRKRIVHIVRKRRRRAQKIIRRSIRRVRPIGRVYSRKKLTISHQLLQLLFLLHVSQYPRNLVPIAFLIIPIIRYFIFLYDLRSCYLLYILLFLILHYLFILLLRKYLLLLLTLLLHFLQLR